MRLPPKARWLSPQKTVFLGFGESHEKETHQNMEPLSCHRKRTATRADPIQARNPTDFTNVFGLSQARENTALPTTII